MNKINLTLILIIIALVLGLYLKNSECAGTHYVAIPDYREPL